MSLLLIFRRRANVAAFEGIGLVDPVAGDLAQLFYGLEIYVCKAAGPLVRTDGCLHDGTIQLFLRLAQGFSYALFCRKCLVEGSQTQVLRQLPQWHREVHHALFAAHIMVAR